MFSDFDYRVLCIEEQNFNVKEMIWNPDNILNIKDGINANVKLLIETKFEYENLKFKLSDFLNVPVEKNGHITNSILEACSSYSIFDFYLDIGKKRISRGKGFMVSPSDFFFKYLPDYNKGKESSLQFKNGLWLVGGGYYSEFGNFSFYYLPEVSVFNQYVEQYLTPSQKEIYAVFYSFNLDFIDGGLNATYRDSLDFGAYTSFRADERFIVYLDAALLKKIKRYTLIKETYPYGGYVYSLKEEELKYKFQFLAGINYIGEDFGIMFEYYYNGSGYSYNELNSFKDDIRLAINNYNTENPISIFNLSQIATLLKYNTFPSLCQHYGMLRIYSLGIKNLELASLCILSLVDFSSRLNNSIEYYVDNIAIGGEFSLTFGDEYLEFKLYGELWSVSLYCRISF